MKKIYALFFAMFCISPFLYAVRLNIPKNSPLLRYSSIELMPITSILNGKERKSGPVLTSSVNLRVKPNSTNVEIDYGNSRIDFVNLYKREFAITARCSMISNSVPIFDDFPEFETFTMKLKTKLQPFSVRTTFSNVNNKLSSNKYFSLNSVKQFVTLWSYVRDCYKNQKLVPARILVNDQLYYAEDYMFDDSNVIREIAIKKANDLRVDIKFHLILDTDTNDWELERITFETSEGVLNMKIWGEGNNGYPTTPWYYYPQKNNTENYESKIAPKL